MTEGVLIIALSANSSWNPTSSQDPSFGPRHLNMALSRKKYSLGTEYVPLAVVKLCEEDTNQVNVPFQHALLEGLASSAYVPFPSNGRTCLKKPEMPFAPSTVSVYEIFIRAALKIKAYERGSIKCNLGVGCLISHHSVFWRRKMDGAHQHAVYLLVFTRTVSSIFRNSC